jgi:hypothetical protein
MSPSNRSANLRLLRAFFDETQDGFGTLVLLSQSSVSLHERDEKTLDKWKADDIERELSLPQDWFDRDNGPLLFVTNEQMLLLEELQGCDAAVVQALRSVVRGLRSSAKANG